jgi:hypothetical protein
MLNNFQASPSWGIWCSNSFGDQAWLRDREGHYVTFPTKAEAATRVKEIKDRQSAFSRCSYKVMEY